MPTSETRSIADLPLLIFVGVTGVGKSTVLKELSQLLNPGTNLSTVSTRGKSAKSLPWYLRRNVPVPDLHLLPDRRTLTDELIIATLQRQDGESVTPVTDRAERFDYTRRYRTQHPGGMAHALTQLPVSGEELNRFPLVFDGLRGEAEITYAAANLPNARFVVLDAPDLVRVQRLLKRKDGFDQIQPPHGSIREMPGIQQVFCEKEIEQFNQWLEQGNVGENELRAKLAIVIAERQNYDPPAAIDSLTRLAPERTLIIDTTQFTPAQIARQIANFIPAPGRPISTSPTLTVTAVETIPFRLPLHEPLAWGKSSRMDDVTHVLLRVTLSDGSQGIAEAPPRPTIYGETVESICAITERELAPRLLGEAVSHERLPTLHARLAQVKNNNAARAAIDMALWDALAAHEGRHLADLLSATRSRIRVSYILGISDEEATMAEAERVVSQGVRVLKVKVGRDWAGDLARIERLQRALGPAVDLYADANECFTAENGAARLAELAERGLLYCEEPLPVEKVVERAALGKQRILPIIGDDSCFTLRDLQRELALNTFDLLNIKTARTGYTESGQMMGTALAAGKGIMVGSQASAGLGTVRAALFTAKEGVEHPSELSFFLKLKEDLLTEPLSLHDGYLDLAQVRQARLDPDRLKEARIQR